MSPEAAERDAAAAEVRSAGRIAAAGLPAPPLRARPGRDGSVLVTVLAKPGAAAAHAGVFRLPDVDAGGCGVEVRCAARPVDGAANADVLAALAAALGVPKRALALVGGGKDRRKTFAVAAAAGPGVDAMSLAARLDALPLG